MIKFEATLAKIGRQGREFCLDRGGATAVEYALVASGVAVAIAVVVFSLGSGVKNLFTTVSGAY